MWMTWLKHHCSYLDLPRDVYEANTLPMLSHINVGCGEDVSIAELAALVAKTIGFTGRITQDASKPDGTMRKLMDVSRLADMGWHAQPSELEDGIRETYAWFLDQAEMDILRYRLTARTLARAALSFRTSDRPQRPLVIGEHYH